MTSRLPVEPIFDQTPHLFGDGPPDPVIYDASIIALRQRTVNFAAKRYADMMFVSGLDRATADRHFRPRAALMPGGLSGRPAGPALQTELKAAHAERRLVVETDPIDRRVTATWNDRAFGDPVVGRAIARPGYGSTVLGQHIAPRFEPRAIARQNSDGGRGWPIGGAVEPPAAAPAAMTSALDAFFASSAGVYGVLIGTPERVLVERYSDFGAVDRATPSWSMTKAITCTVIGRMIYEGWFHSVHDPAPAPL